MTTDQKAPDFVQQVAQLNLAIANRLNAALKPYDVTANNYFYLLKVQEHPGVVQRALNEIIDLNPSSVTRAVNHLIAAGDLLKQTDSKDRRATRLFLTKQGEQKAIGIRGVVNRLNSDLMAQSSVSASIYEQVMQLREVLRQFD